MLLVYFFFEVKINKNRSQYRVSLWYVDSNCNSQMNHNHSTMVWLQDIQDCHTFKF